MRRAFLALLVALILVGCASEPRHLQGTIAGREYEPPDEYVVIVSCGPNGAVCPVVQYEPAHYFIILEVGRGTEKCEVDPASYDRAVRGDLWEGDCW